MVTDVRSVGRKQANGRVSAEHMVPRAQISLFRPRVMNVGIVGARVRRRERPRVRARATALY